MSAGKTLRQVGYAEPVLSRNVTMSEMAAAAYMAVVCRVASTTFHHVVRKSGTLRGVFPS